MRHIFQNIHISPTTTIGLLSFTSEGCALRLYDFVNVLMISYLGVNEPACQMCICQSQLIKRSVWQGAMLVIFIAFLISLIIPQFHCFSQWYRTCWQQQLVSRQQLIISQSRYFIYLQCNSQAAWELMGMLLALKIKWKRMN